jgi:hypothetical protein
MARLRVLGEITPGGLSWMRERYQAARRQNMA